MPIQVTDNTGSPKQGKKIDSATMPTGGKGVIGWLSAIWYKLTQGITVSGTVTATTGGLTDTELRATPVPVSGTVTATTGGLTDTQLRATPVIVDVLNDSTATGTLTSSSDTVIISDTTGYATATIRVSGTWSVVGSGIYVYGESTNLVRLYVLNITGGNILSNIITNGLYVVNIAGCSYIKVRASDGIGGAGADITVRLSTLVHPLLYKQVEGVIDADLAATNVKPVLLGGIAFNSSPTSVSSDGDLSRLWTRRNGAVVIDTPNSDFSTSTKQDTQITSLQLIDDIVHSLNATLDKVAAIGAQLDDTSTTSATEDKIAPLRMTAKRALHTNLRKDDGTEIGTSSNPVYTTQGTSSTTYPGTDRTATATWSSSSQTLLIETYDCETVYVNLNMTSYSGTIAIYGSYDNVSGTWVDVKAYKPSLYLSTSIWQSQVFTAFSETNFQFFIPCAGFKYIKLSEDAYTSGSVVINTISTKRSNVNFIYPIYGFSIPVSGYPENSSSTVMQLAARTTDQSIDFVNTYAKGVIITLVVTAITATPSITLRIRIPNGNGGYEYLNAAPTAVTATGVHTYILYPGADITEVGDSVQTTSVPLPYYWNLFIDHLDADSITYMVTVQYIL